MNHQKWSLLCSPVNLGKFSVFNLARTDSLKLFLITRSFTNRRDEKKKQDFAYDCCLRSNDQNLKTLNSFGLAVFNENYFIKIYLTNQQSFDAANQRISGRAEFFIDFIRESN